MKLGIIGGSGLEDPNLIQDYQEKEVTTIYGKPSSSLILGKISGVDIVFLSRHGKKHEIPPTHVNNKANIQALKNEGVTHIIATTACGSLREEIARGDFIILDQFIDFTRRREVSFYDKFEQGAIHASMSEPFSEFLREKIISACKELNIKHHKKGTVVTIEGARFSTKAESNMFRLWGADVINMSIAPEAILARELDIEYATIAMSTDYDCWKEEEAPVTWNQILEIFSQNSEKMKKLLMKTIQNISIKKEDIIKSKIRKIPHFPKQGILFWDITTLLKDAKGLSEVIKEFFERYKGEKIDIIAGIESRGFILGGALANSLGIGFVPLRKPNKLPAEKERIEYKTEYSTDAIEIHKDAIKPGDKVILVDDLIATGGTALAAAQLIERLGGKIIECAFVVDLPELKGSEKLREKGYKVFRLVDCEDGC